MSEAINEKKVGNYLIEIFPDNNPDSPRNWDNLGIMVCHHSRYDLGDKHGYDHKDYSGWKEMEKAIVKENNVGVILPLYLYDHSGITISTTPFSCGWDSGRIGFIYVSKEDVLKEFGGKIVTKKLKEKAEGILKGEVETYDQYLRGDIYGYKISKVSTCEQGNEHKEEIDSCWGFYGEDYCMEEAEGVVQYYIKEETEKAA
jgi:hypothetical protein